MSELKLWFDANAEGVGTGTEADPFSSYDSINWDTGGANSITDLVAADYDISILSKGVFYERLVVGASGKIGHPITIGKWGPDDFIVDGSYIPDPWEEVGGEVWMHKEGWIVMYLSEDGVSLQPTISSDLPNDLARGQWGYYDNDSPSLSRLYYRSSDGLPPSEHSIRIACSRKYQSSKGMFEIISKSYVNVSGMVSQNFFSNVTPQNGVWIENTENCNFDFTCKSCIQGPRIRGCNTCTLDLNVSDTVTSGLIVEGDIDTLFITGNYSYNGNKKYYQGNEDYEYSGDADGIGIGGAGGTMANIYLNNCLLSFNGKILDDSPSSGSGVSIGTTSDMSVENLVIMNNKFLGNHGKALFIRGQCKSSLTYKNLFIDTTEVDVSEASTLWVSLDYDTYFTGTGNHKIINNVFMRNKSEQTIRVWSDGSELSIINNIFYNNGRALGYNGDIKIGSALTTELTESNNCFYRDDLTLTGIPAITYHVTTYDIDHIIGVLAGTWQFDRSLGSDDIVEDPKVSATGKLSKDSPCINTGLVVPGVNDGTNTDFFGHMNYGPQSIGIDWAALMPNKSQQILNLTSGMFG